MFFDNQYQISYVTPDLRKATGLMEARFGVEFKDLSGQELVRNTVWTPEGDADIEMRLGIAILGHLTIELLEPVSGATKIFTDMIEPGRLVKLHHFGMRCRDLEAMRRENEKIGRKVVMEGGFKTVRFMYVDARADLGHFMEYSTAPPGFWDR